jgi:hypothetical protein
MAFGALLELALRAAAEAARGRDLATACDPGARGCDVRDIIRRVRIHLRFG